MKYVGVLKIVTLKNRVKMGDEIRLINTMGRSSEA